jgi:DNA-binding response OmpR family regulator
MNVLIWSNNHVLSDLMARNLVRRGFDVRERPLPTATALRGTEVNADLVVVDLDCQEPDLWRHASHIRGMLPRVPLVILGHAWPATPRLDRLQPCSYVRKPFAIDTLLDAVKEVPARRCAQR